MGSSFVIGYSLLRIRVQLEGRGQAPPWQGPWGAPSPLCPSPTCNLSPSPLDSLLMQGLPQFRGFGFQGAVSPSLCPGHLKSFCYLLGLWERTFFPLRTHPCSSHCHLCLSLIQLCHHRGMGGAERVLHPRQPKAVGRGDTAPPFPACSSSLIKTCL